MYFVWNEKKEKGFNGLRGQFISLCFDKVNGETKILNGVLCRSGKGKFLVNEGVEGDADFKSFNVNKIKWVRINGITHYPKEGSDEISNVSNEQTVSVHD